MATYSVINSSIKGNEAVTEQNKTLTALQRAFTILESDITQLAQRQIRIDGEQPVKAYFRSGEYMFDSDGIGFGFVRDGWTNPQMILPRSELQAVAYRLKEQKLQRLYFNYVDNEMGAEPRIQDLLMGVESIILEYSVNDEWVEELNENSVPVMVKVGLETQTYGLVERKFPIVSVIDKPEVP
jgi:general secretion pathway protein J